MEALTIPSCFMLVFLLSGKSLWLKIVKCPFLFLSPTGTTLLIVFQMVSSALIWSGPLEAEPGPLVLGSTARAQLWSWNRKPMSPYGRDSLFPWNGPFPHIWVSQFLGLESSVQPSLLVHTQLLSQVSSLPCSGHHLVFSICATSLKVFVLTVSIARFSYRDMGRNPDLCHAEST